MSILLFKLCIGHLSWISFLYFRLLRLWTKFISHLLKFVLHTVFPVSSFKGFLLAAVNYRLCSNFLIGLLFCLALEEPKTKFFFFFSNSTDHNRVRFFQTIKSLLFVDHLLKCIFIFPFSPSLPFPFLSLLSLSHFENLETTYFESWL